MTGPVYVRGALTQGVAAALVVDLLRKVRPVWEAYPKRERDEVAAYFEAVAREAADFHAEVDVRKVGRSPERATRPVGSSEVPAGQVRSGWAHDEITVRQAAQLMGGITERAALNRVRAHELGRKVGGVWAVSEPAVKADVARRAGRSA